MEIYLDDEPATFDAASLAAALHEARAALEPRGRLVVEVQVDGETLTPEQIEQAGDAPAGDGELRLYSADPRELAIDALDQVRTRLAQVRDDQQAAAELLQQDHAAEAMRKVGECIAGWIQAQEAVGLAANLGGITLEAVEVGDQPAAATMKRLVEGLHAMKDALVQRDTVAIADALAYEWPEHVDEWDRLVEAVTAHLEEADLK